MQGCSEKQRFSSLALKLISSLTCALFLHSSLASSTVAQTRPVPQSSPAIRQESTASDPVMTTLRLGDPAPFPGTLFSVPAVARLLADLEFTQEKCDIQVSARIRLTEANMQLQIDTERARFTALEYRHTEIMRVRDDQIQFLTKQHRPESWYESGEFWFGLGSVVGVIITVAAGYALGQAYN